MGIMSSFSVAKKVTEEEVHRYFSKQKRNGKSEEQIGKMLQEKILGEITTAIQKNEIPGLLKPEELALSMNANKNIVEKMPELNKIIIVIAHKLSEKKYDKMSLCYFINSMVNVLGLSEEDFQKFHKQNVDDDDDDDDDEGEEYKKDA